MQSSHINYRKNDKSKLNNYDNHNDNDKINANNNNIRHNNHHNIHQQIHIAICIIGQIKQLELQSKLDNIIHYNNYKNQDKNNSLQHHYLYVISILDHDNNDDNDLLSQENTNDNEQTDINWIQNEFLSANIPFRGEFIRSKSSLSLLSSSSSSSKDRHDSDDDGIIYNIPLPLLRQFEQDKRCYEMLTDIEHSINIQFDIVLRLHDNTIFTSPVDLINIINFYHHHHYKHDNNNDDNETVFIQKTANCITNGIWIIPKLQFKSSLTNIIDYVNNKEKYLHSSSSSNSKSSSSSSNCSIDIDSSIDMDDKISQLIHHVFKYYQIPLKEVSSELMGLTEIRCEIDKIDVNGIELLKNKRVHELILLSSRLKVDPTTKQSNDYIPSVNQDSDNQPLFAIIRSKNAPLITNNTLEPSFHDSTGFTEESNFISSVDLPPSPCLPLVYAYAHEIQGAPSITGRSTI